MNIHDLRMLVQIPQKISEKSKDKLFELWDKNHNIIKYGLKLVRIFEGDDELRLKNEQREQKYKALKNAKFQSETNIKSFIKTQSIDSCDADDSIDDEADDERYDVVCDFDYVSNKTNSVLNIVKNNICDELCDELFSDDKTRDDKILHQDCSRICEQSREQSRRQMREQSRRQIREQVRRQARRQSRIQMREQSRRQSREIMEKNTIPLRVDIYYYNTKIGHIEEDFNKLTVGRDIHEHELLWDKNFPEDILLHVYIK